MSAVEDGATRRMTPYERIKQAILDGTFEPGAALVESSVAEWCGVSRTPVREALTRLEQDGLIARTERGVIVRERTPEEILDIYEVRIALESVAARIAAERASAIDRVRLERLCTLAEEADPNDGDQLAERNREFHRGIVRASHNESLIDVLDRLDMHLLRYPATTLQYPGRWEKALVEHRNMVEAIAARDADRAADLASHHFTTARDVRLTLWENELS